MGFNIYKYRNGAVLTKPFDTSTGQLIFHMFGALAEFERNLMRERTKAGLASARARGRLEALKDLGSDTLCI